MYHCREVCFSRKQIPSLFHLWGCYCNHSMPHFRILVVCIAAYYFIGIIMHPYKYEYGQYRVIFPSVSIWRPPVLWSLTKILLYTPIEEYNVYSLGNWAMSCCLTSDVLSFPLNLQYNSLPIEKAARTPYSPQLMYLILSIFTLLFYFQSSQLPLALS